MKIRYLAYIAILVTGVIWADAAWSAPRKASAAAGPGAAHAYVVRAGDGGWWRVAHAHGVSLQQLLAANHATAATPLKVGETLQLPATKGAKVPKPATGKAASRAAPAKR